MPQRQDINLVPSAASKSPNPLALTSNAKTSSIPTPTDPTLLVRRSRNDTQHRPHTSPVIAEALHLIDLVSSRSMKSTPNTPPASLDPPNTHHLSRSKPSKPTAFISNAKDLTLAKPQDLTVPATCSPQDPHHRSRTPSRLTSECDPTPLHSTKSVSTPPSTLLEPSHPSRASPHPAPTLLQLTKSASAALPDASAPLQHLKTSESISVATFSYPRSRTVRRYLEKVDPELNAEQRAAFNLLLERGILDKIAFHVRHKSSQTSSNSQKVQPSLPNISVEPSTSAVLSTPATLSTSSVPSTPAVPLTPAMASISPSPRSTPSITPADKPTYYPIPQQIPLPSRQFQPLPPAPPLSSILLVQQRIIDLILKGRERMTKIENLFLKGREGGNNGSNYLTHLCMDQASKGHRLTGCGLQVHDPRQDNVLPFTNDCMTTEGSHIHLSSDQAPKGHKPIGCGLQAHDLRQINFSKFTQHFLSHLFQEFFDKLDRFTSSLNSLYQPHLKRPEGEG